MTIKTDCFAYKMRDCAILKELMCKEGVCPFYKTQKTV